MQQAMSLIHGGLTPYSFMLAGKEDIYQLSIIQSQVCMMESDDDDDDDDDGDYDERSG